MSEESKSGAPSELADALEALLRFSRGLGGCPISLPDNPIGIAEAALMAAGRPVIDAAEPPPDSEVASDSSALEKALGALRWIASPKYGLQGLMEDSAPESAFAAYWKELAQHYEAHARAALSGGAHVDGPKAP